MIRLIEHARRFAHGFYYGVITGAGMDPHEAVVKALPAGLRDDLWKIIKSELEAFRDLGREDEYYLSQQEPFIEGLAQTWRTPRWVARPHSFKLIVKALEAYYQ